MRPIVTYRVEWYVCRLVCRSVGHTSEPCQNDWRDQDAVWSKTIGPKEPCVRRGPDRRPGKGQFWGGTGVQSWGTCTLRLSVQKRLNRSRYRFGCWLVYVPKKSCVRWGPDPLLDWEGTNWGIGAPILKYKDFLPWAVQNGWSDWFTVWVVDSVGPKEYDWNACLRRRCLEVYGTVAYCRLGNALRSALVAILQDNCHPSSYLLNALGTLDIIKLLKQFLFVVKATALKQQISKFYPQILNIDASDHIYVSQWPAINVKASFCASVDE